VALKANDHDENVLRSFFSLFERFRMLSVAFSNSHNANFALWLFENDQNALWLFYKRPERVGAVLKRPERILVV
jgi:hypothetical protein